MNRYSHIDLRVNSWEKVRTFYENLLPALGFTRTFHSEKWKVFAAEGELPSVPYFAITEDPNHKPNENLIGFWAHDREEVDRIAELVVRYGAPSTAAPGSSRSVRLIMRFIFRILAETSMKWSTD
ncbi:hypothetical protein Q4O60_07240 [Aeribacillus pallidus]|nr:hypothetical protein [Aeribacillus pallidus]